MQSPNSSARCLKASGGMRDALREAPGALSARGGTGGSGGAAARPFPRRAGGGQLSAAAAVPPHPVPPPPRCPLEAERRHWAPCDPSWGRNGVRRSPRTETALLEGDLRRGKGRKRQGEGGGGGISLSSSAKREQGSPRVRCGSRREEDLVSPPVAEGEAQLPPHTHTLRVGEKRAPRTCVAGGKRSLSPASLLGTIP